jgi:nicotinamidase-related amidase
MTETIIGKPVLIVIDVQRDGYLGKEQSGIPRMPGFEEVVGRIARVVRSCRSAGMPVIFTQEIHRRDLIDFGRELDGDEGVHCLEGDPSTELCDELGAVATDYVIRKRRYSCFFGTDLDILLRGLSANTLLLTGGLTDVCVHYTFVDAHQRDFHVRVVEDCVIGSAPARHEAALEAMEYLQHGARITSATLLGHLEGEAVA